MVRKFEDKVVLITGAGSGIGRATSIKLAALGAILALSDIQSDALAETRNLCEGEKHTVSVFDVGSTDSSNKFIEEVMTQFGQIDHVFNCAGINPTSYPTEDVTDEYWNKLMNTNIKGVFNITRASIPHLRTGASFVNVSSILGISAGAELATYCATKHAIIGFSKCIALELGPKGIRTNIIAPGYIDTPTNALVVSGADAVRAGSNNIALGRFGTAEEIADVVAFLFSDESRYMNGSVVEINGGRR
ncbi:3-alpha-(or 20-beta)-hydroxysteroid dehydrogenase [Phlyctema vagabunda]|uniref:3-alpha-(Or 20-beta)-hydroxysteroid dehydrogenase n=1 Tax=Phlyctema vagabunda TaxID=108571 RepID=A0ABR4PJ38_9HELO